MVPGPQGSAWYPRDEVRVSRWRRRGNLRRQLQRNVLVSYKKYLRGVRVAAGMYAKECKCISYLDDVAAEFRPTYIT